MWSFSKENVYANNPEQLQINIMQNIDEIEQNIWKFEIKKYRI